MNPDSKVNSLRKLRILVVPLDWGLGHATRCIPVIYELLEHKCDVFVAGEGSQVAILKQEFPNINFLQLPGYRVRYGRSKISLFWNILRQSGRILKAIKNENSWLEKMTDEHGFDAVISDNRYGLYHKKVPSIFITHQLNIKSPLGKWHEHFLQKRNYGYINRFTECWVPDEAGENNLAGELSHPPNGPVIPLKYIGILSRFDDITGLQPKPGRLLITLSGPEPQRSILEEKIINEIAHYPGRATIVRGLPASANIIPSANAIRFFNHLNTEDLNKEMLEAEYIICRSGYSSVMDIMKLKKKSILIPTPGQTEQEYLGQYLSKRKLAFCIRQNEFSIAKAISPANDFSYVFLSSSGENQLKKVVATFINSLR